MKILILVGTEFDGFANVFVFKPIGDIGHQFGSVLADGDRAD